MVTITIYDTHENSKKFWEKFSESYKPLHGKSAAHRNVISNFSIDHSYKGTITLEANLYIVWRILCPSAPNGLYGRGCHGGTMVHVVKDGRRNTMHILPS